MKSLMIRGSIATGKTTTSRTLFNLLRRNNFPCSYFSFDYFYKNFFYSTFQEFSEERVLESGKHFVPLIKGIQEGGRFPIIEGVFIEPLFNYVNSELDDMYTITLTCDLKKCVERNLTRKKVLDTQHVIGNWKHNKGNLFGEVIRTDYQDTDTIVSYLYDKILNESYNYCYYN